MASEKITDLPIANTIDPVADTFPIVTSNINTTQQISRNTFLSLSSAPVGLTDSQTIQNKVINNTNSATLKDGSFTLQNSSSTTKQTVFSLSGITAGNTRTITLPDYNATMASLAGTETFTNKTLTSPTITSPTITNATISADAVTGFSSSNTGTVYGVSVSSGVIASAALNNAVNTAALQSSSVTTAKIAANAVDYTKVATGFCVQEVSSITGAVNTGTTNIPNDDTIPQSTEGDQYMSLSITPKLSTSTLVIEVVMYLSNSTVTTGIMALFQDTNVNAIAAAQQRFAIATAVYPMPMYYTMTSGTTSTTTFKVRAGASTGDGGTMTFNGQSGARRMGGVMSSALIIREYTA